MVIGRDDLSIMIFMIGPVCVEEAAFRHLVTTSPWLSAHLCCNSNKVYGFTVVRNTKLSIYEVEKI
jgi:hypothetical protein